MKKVVPWIVVVLALILSVDYFVKKNIISGVFMLVAAFMWTPLASTILEKNLHVEGKQLLMVQVIVLLIAVVVSSVRISF